MDTNAKFQFRIKITGGLLAQLFQTIDKLTSGQKLSFLVFFDSTSICKQSHDTITYEFMTHSTADCLFTLTLILSPGC
ncbi:MAG: hypothetical protein P8M25_05495, partial [Paracoccaceae bacterium]|nr:hypothetical protein [Paracoccaceae bacterium]